MIWKKEPTALNSRKQLSFSYHIFLPVECRQVDKINHLGVVVVVGVRVAGGEALYLSGAGWRMISFLHKF